MKYTEKIDKYLDGEMAPQEATAFEQEVKTDPELAREVKLHQLAIAGVQHSEEARFQEFKARMEAIENEDEVAIEEPQSDEEVKKPEPRMKVVESKVNEDEASNRRVRRWIIGIAAVLIPLLFLYFLLPFSGGQSNPIAVNKKITKPCFLYLTASFRKTARTVPLPKS